MPDPVRPRGRTNGDATTRTMMPLAAYRFKNTDVYTTGGQPGKVRNILIGDDGRYYAAVDFGADLGKHQVPIASFTFEDGRFIVHESDIRALPSFVEGQRGLRSVEPSTTLDIRGYRASIGDDSSIVVQDAPAHITVERHALAINWEQAGPQVTVHQPTPFVSVRQAQPVITVRQPAPKITVELEQPEIIVRMSDPEVDVAIAEPQVQVNVPKPLVQVVQPDQPQVKISTGDPLVSLTPRSPAEIAIERGTADVRFERVGEPQVIVRQLDGAPRIRFEEVARQEIASTVRAAGVANTRGFVAGQLEGRKVFSVDGQEIGSVHRILAAKDGSLVLVVARGAFLGLAAHKIVLPLSNFAMQGDRLVIRNMKLADIGRIEPWDESMTAYRAAAADAGVKILRD